MIKNVTFYFVNCCELLVHFSLEFFDYLEFIFNQSSDLVILAYVGSLLFLFVK